MRSGVSRFRKFVFLIALLSICSEIPLLAAEIPRAELQQQIDTIIRMRHPKDTRDWWLGLGAQAPAVIIGMLESSEYREEILQRMRLMQGLAWFTQDSTALEYLKQQAQATNEEVVRRTVIEAIGQAQGAKEADYISKFLQSSDLQTRLSAAESLKRMKDPHANQLLETYLSTEKTPWLLDRINGTSQTQGRLKAVASSENRLSREFSGTWKGFWIFPQRSPKGPLLQREGILNLKILGEDNLEGVLTLPLRPKMPSVTYQLKAKGKGLLFSGNAKNASDTGEMVVQGQLMRRAGVLILEIYFEATTFVAISLRK